MNSNLNEAENDIIHHYHKIWSYIHSVEFFSQTFDKQLKLFETIILDDLSFCACGQDAHFIITCMLKYAKQKSHLFDTNEKCQIFWISFHNLIRQKLGQSIIVPTLTNLI